MLILQLVEKRFFRQAGRLSKEHADKDMPPVGVYRYGNGTDAKLIAQLEYNSDGNIARVLSNTGEVHEFLITEVGQSNSIIQPDSKYIRYLYAATDRAGSAPRQMMNPFWGWISAIIPRPVSGSTISIAEHIMIPGAIRGA